MDEAEIRKIVSSVMQKYAGNHTGNVQNPSGVPMQESASVSRIEIPLEVSARHVHLTQDAMDVLFGKGATLTFKRALSQPGQFLSEEKVRLVTMKGSIERVFVLGPLRSAVQVELSLTECRMLGINAPVNLSGDHTGAGDIIIVGPNGVLNAEGCVIAAKAHIHLDTETAKKRGLSDKQNVKVRIHSKRPVCLEDVAIRVSDNFAPAMHIDFDEANACACDSGTSIEIET